MVQRDGTDGFMLIDFDWAGRAEEVRYPMNVNRAPELLRPEGVLDKVLILSKHDREMVRNMFNFVPI